MIYWNSSVFTCNGWANVMLKQFILFQESFLKAVLPWFHDLLVLVFIGLPSHTASDTATLGFILSCSIYSSLHFLIVSTDQLLTPVESLPFSMGMLSATFLGVSYECVFLPFTVHLTLNFSSVFYSGLPPRPCREVPGLNAQMKNHKSRWGLSCGGH